ncbi:MAG: 50S ribosomal protein P1 [Nitrososphaerota archaeon]|nr:50S ribosomal protein P1 [Candidatus Bathyarchaeota archaeon]MDW8048766.1 50S ribosomal protein P1 [Nitrososphaerota archaeon]
MEYIYAAMLLHRAGKPIDEDNITKVLEAAGITVDQHRVKALVAALSEIDISEAIKSAPPFMAAPQVPSAAPSAPTTHEKPKEEKKEEKTEEEALAGLGALFG